MELEEYLKVLILQTLDLKQEAAARILGRGRGLVREAETWFKGLGDKDAFDFVDGQRIKRLVNRDFAEIDLTPDQLLKAGQVTGDDILLHYGRIRPQPVPVVDPARLGLLRDHWAGLRGLAEAFRMLLEPPGVAELFGKEACRKVHQARRAGSPSRAVSLGGFVFDFPVEGAVPADESAGAIEARFSLEAAYLFPHLVTHLEAESAEFIALFGAWRHQMASLLTTCLGAVADVVQDCPAATGLDYPAEGKDTWLTFHFPACVCRYVLDGRLTEPGFDTETLPGGLVRLWPREPLVVPLAQGTAAQVRRCRDALISEIERQAGRRVWPEIRRALADSPRKAGPLRVVLTEAIERGDFKAACDVCRGYFTSPPARRG